MSLEVIGAGFGRTGTLSLKYALEQLGFDKCYHMMEVGMNEGHTEQWIAAAQGQPIDWHRLFHGYKAAVDWPSCNFWREQMAAFPQAKVILSRRDPNKWYDSVMNTIWQVTTSGAQQEDPKSRVGAEMAYTVVWDPVFGRRMDDRAHVIACYEEHNQRVLDTVPADQLLDYEPGAGWAPLCEFLNVPVPETDFPRVNTTEEFTERWKKIAEETQAHRDQI